jgi:hypothetical protein
VRQGGWIRTPATAQCTGEECDVRTPPLSPIQATLRPLPLSRDQESKNGASPWPSYRSHGQNRDERQRPGRPLVRERPTTHGEVSDVRTGGAI